VENIFKQQGVINLSVHESTENTHILSLIQGALSSVGATNLIAQNNTLHFEGGNTPFKSNINPLMGVSSGELELFTSKGYYHVRYTLQLIHLLFWCTLSAILFGVFVAVNSQQTGISTLFSGLASGTFGFGFIYFGYYALTVVRFPRLLQKAVSNEKS